MLALVVLTATALRVFLADRAHATTLDTAVVGQMALDILKGDRPLFFAGQNYMGALEAYVLALFFFWLPANPVTMTFATITFTIAWIIATFVFFRKAFGPGPALVAALVPAFPGWSAVWYSTAPYGGYPQTYAFGMTLLWLALFFPPHHRRWMTWLHAGLLSLITCLGVWTNLQILPYWAAAMAIGVFRIRKQPGWFTTARPYILVPVAFIFAMVPQWLAESSHVHPPMFGGFSLTAAEKSWRALWVHDLAHNLLWTFKPAIIHTVVSVLIALLIAGACFLNFRSPPPAPRTKVATASVFLMLCFFALSYFPHPMSGFVPRYLIGPVILLVSWSIAVWTSRDSRGLSRAGYVFAIILGIYNVHGTVDAARQRTDATRRTLSDYAQTIEAARKNGWKTLMHAGSETEGYDGARFTLLSGGDPVVTSAFSDRFLHHQLAWELGTSPAYLVKKSHLSFMLGSYQAMRALPGLVDEQAPYAMVENPPVVRRLETSMYPEAIEGYEGDMFDHPLFDRNNATSWTTTEETSRLVFQFSKPERLSGIRATASSPRVLPYRYELRVQLADGSWQTAQQTDQRIAGSYISGQTVYFRGHHPWMDIRIEPVDVIALAWQLKTGPANPQPPALTELYILTDEGKVWPESRAAMDKITSWWTRYPEAKRWCERGVMRQLHQHALQNRWPEHLMAQIPLPYNPRFSRTLPERMELPPGDMVLIVESAYQSDVSRVFSVAGIPLEQLEIVEPYALIKIAIPETADQRLMWDGFTAHLSR